MPWDCRNIITSRMARCSTQAVADHGQFFLGNTPAPRSAVRMSFSNMSRVSLPKCRTIFLAVLGPTPLISPEPRYFSRAAVVAGFFSTAFDGLELAAEFGVNRPGALKFHGGTGKHFGLMNDTVSCWWGLSKGTTRRTVQPLSGLW